jgi:hypothetical protein
VVVKILDAESVIQAGGWDPRYARVLAIATVDDIAAALIDTNGDGADIDLDQYERVGDGDWQENISGAVGDEGVSWSPRIAATWGQAAPGETVEIEFLRRRSALVTSETGWWLFIGPATDDVDMLPRRWIDQRR